MKNHLGKNQWCSLARLLAAGLCLAFGQMSMATEGGGSVYAVNAIGPYVAWVPAPNYGLLAKLQVESGARNRAEGSRFWLQGRYAF